MNQDINDFWNQDLETKLAVLHDALTHGLYLSDIGHPDPVTNRAMKVEYLTFLIAQKRGDLIDE